MILEYLKLLGRKVTRSRIIKVDCLQFQVSWEKLNDSRTKFLNILCDLDRKKKKKNAQLHILEIHCGLQVSSHSGENLGRKKLFKKLGL